MEVRGTRVRASKETKQGVYYIPPKKFRNHVRVLMHLILKTKKGGEDE